MEPDLLSNFNLLKSEAPFDYIVTVLRTPKFLRIQRLEEHPI